MYYIIFTEYKKDSHHSGLVAKRYTGIPDEKQKEICNIFKFSIVDEKEFNKIKALRKIIL